MSSRKVLFSSSLMALLLSSFFVLLGGSNNAQAQEVEASAGSDVSAASGSNRFVVWRDTIGEGRGDIYFKRSTDNGANWKASVNLSNNAGTSDNPKLAVSGANVFVAWSQNSADGTKHDIFLKRSTNNGATWGGNIKITPGGTCTTASGSCHAIDSLTASGANLYLLTEKSGDIFLRRSSDNGAIWKTPVNISSNVGISSDPDIAVSGSNVYLTWFQENSARTSQDILFRRSTDNGATWKSKVNLSNDLGQSRGPDIAASGSNVYVTWSGDVTFPDERTFMGILFKNSNDGGATWTSIKVLSDHPIDDPDDDGQMVGAQSPQVVASGSNVYMAWFDNVFLVEKASGSMDVVFRRSLDGGNTWDPVVVLDDSNSSEGCPQIELAVSGSMAYLAWLLSDEACNWGRIEFSLSTDDGATWSAPRSMADVFLKGAMVGSLELTVSNSSVFLVIARDMGGPGSDIFIARSTNAGETWGLGLNLSKTSGISDHPQMGL
ncbi:MAG TPA: sialidase family protein [Nitrososphaera sp.]|nr:sialidase family protein [Nitrososphaera sp.]